MAVAEMRFEAAVELLAARHYADAVNLFYSFNLDESLDIFDQGLRAAARFNLGVARAAEAEGDTALAASAYRRLTTIWRSADPDHAGLAEARAYLE